MLINKSGKRRKRCVIVHINNIKEWNEEPFIIHRITIAEEQDGGFQNSKLVFADQNLSNVQNKILKIFRLCPVYSNPFHHYF